MMTTETNSATLSVGTTPSLVKVVVVEDHRELRDYISFMINSAEGYRCIGSYRTMEEAIQKIPGDVPDVVLSDIGLPGMSGIEGVKILKERFPQILILMITVYDDDDRIFDALCAGASGYLLKKTAPAKLLDSLKEAMGGGAPMSPEVARRVISLFRDVRPPERADYDLTPHETRLLKLLVEGHNYKTAAAKLGVTTATISFHLQRIYEKLQVHSKSEAVAKAIKNRIV